jgi:hypothetical protein
VLLHLHLPKTAGTTLNSILYVTLWEQASPRTRSQATEEPFFHWGIYHYPFGFFKQRSAASSSDAQRFLKHPMLTGVFGHFSYGVHDAIGKPSDYVTMVREPMSRARSLAAHIRRYPRPGYLPSRPRLHRALVDEGIGLRELAERFRLTEFDNDQARRISGENPPFGKCNDGTLARAKDHLARFAVVGTTERFDESVAAMATHLGWTTVYPYQRALVTPKSHENVSVDDIESVRSMNELDRELHRFAGELLEERIALLGDAVCELLGRITPSSAPRTG